MIKASSWRGQDCAYAHMKLDGINLEVHRAEKGIRCYSRLSNITEELKACGWLRPIVELMPMYATVYGELWVPGRKASHVKSAIVNAPETLRFNGFAIDHQSVAEDAELADMNVQLMAWGIQPIDFLVHEQLRYEGLGGVGWFDDPKKLLDDLPDDVEGYVLKDGNLNRWFKLKPVLTADLIVTRIKPGKGKYEGQAGALICSTYDGREMANVSGMSDAERADITDGDIGRVVEVSYQYVGEGGRLRHPAFVRWRDDKPAKDCLFND